MKPCFLLICLLLLQTMSVNAQIEVKNVVFPANKSSTTINGKIQGRQAIDYAVSAKTGQQMNVSLSSKHGALYFNVLPPGSNDVAIFIGSVSGNKFDTILTQSGTYKIRVYLMASAARRNEKADYSFTLRLASTEKTR